MGSAETGEPPVFEASIPLCLAAPQVQYSSRILVPGAPALHPRACDFPPRQM
jgi:hypothetical protein